MAFLNLKIRACLLLNSKLPCLFSPRQCALKRKLFTSKDNIQQSLTPARIRTTCSSATEKSPEIVFETSPVTQFSVTEEIQFYRHCGNQFSQITFSDTRSNYGPPLAIILPWKGLDETMLRKFVEFYGEKGFDVLTVTLKMDQLLYPCTAGHSMNVVSDLLGYLNDSHKHRPYIFHGFSIGVYVFGEIMAQFSDQYETYREIMNNVKGCLWDSPVDFLTVKPYVGKYLYPRNWVSRWRCNAAVKRHFKRHYHDSVVYWIRSRDNFCNPIVKVPYVFFVSYTDLLSNPASLTCAQKVLECNGVPIFQKTWWDSPHAHHFEKYCYEYTYGMVLFFNLASLFPDECGKYWSSHANASLSNLRLRKKAREGFS